MPINAVVRTLLQEITRELSHIERSSREAQLLLMHHLSCDELWLMTNQNAEVDHVEKLMAMVERRKQNEPLEYITNKVSFYSEEFYIDQGALIPRPETELLIDEVLENIPDPDAKITLVEVGVGSGIISIMLAKHLPHAKIIAVDISEAALDVTKKNLEKFGLQDRIELRLGSLLEPVSEEIDYLVSNPPYIANDFEVESNLDYEPQNALFGGEVGDELIQKLLNDVLNRGISFFSCEMGYDQKDKITKFLNDSKYQKLQFYKDYSGFDRGFTLKV